MNLEIKGVSACSKNLTQQFSRNKKQMQQTNKQEWRPRAWASRSPRPSDVPQLDFGRLVDSDNEDGPTYFPINTVHLHFDAPNSSSTIKSWDVNLSYADDLSNEQMTIPENLPPPTQKYRQKYQQYQTEMKEGYKRHSQINSAKKTPKILFQKSPKIIDEICISSHSSSPISSISIKKNEQVEKQVNNSITALDKKALLQKCYTNSPFNIWQCQKRSEAEVVAAEKKKQAVVEQVMIDQLSRAVISDPEQNLTVGNQRLIYLPLFFEKVPLRPRKRTLHETKIQPHSALTENILSNKLRFDARVLSRNGRDACRELMGFFFAHDKSLTIYEYRQFCSNRTNALPFINKSIYSHQHGPKKGKQYRLQDFYVGANLTFLSSEHLSLPESIKENPLITLRITHVDQLTLDDLRKNFMENGEDLNEQEASDRSVYKNLQDQFKEKLKQKAVRILTGLGKYFRQQDKKGNGLLCKADIKEALKKFNLEMSEKDFEDLWAILDIGCNGQVDYGEFKRAIFGEMNEYRKTFLRKAYMKLDFTKTGSVSMVDIRKFYCAKKHPHVMSGCATEEEIKSSFIETLQNACSHSLQVLYCEFEDYYEGLSFEISNDEDFINILRNSWGI